MDEAEWLAATYPTLMLEFLRETGNASERRCRLFACASARWVWRLLVDERSKRAVEIAEASIDGSVDADDLATALEAAKRAVPSVDDARPCSALEQAAAAAAQAAIHLNAQAAATMAWGWSRNIWVATKLIEPSQLEQVLSPAKSASLIRDIFGNPFRRVSFEPGCLGLKESTVQEIAQSIYDESAFDRLPALGEALEEADWTATEIIKHCRSPGPHVRGCWVVDLLLGKK